MNNTPLNQVSLQDLVDAVLNLTGAIDGLAANVDGLIQASSTPAAAPAPAVKVAPAEVAEAPAEEKPKTRRGRKKKEEASPVAMASDIIEGRAEPTQPPASAQPAITPPLTTTEMQDANNELIQISTRLGDGGTSIFQIMGELGLRSLADIGTNRPLFNTLMERVRALEA